MKSFLLLVVTLTLTGAHSAFAFESGFTSLRCYDYESGGSVVNYDFQWDNDGSQTIDLSLLAHNFHGSALPKNVLASVNLDLDRNSPLAVQLSYNGADQELTLAASADAIHKDSQDGSFGNDLYTFTFPAELSVKSKNAQGASYKKKVRCRAESGRNGMEG